MNTLFVYGLLKPGLSLHHVVAPFVERSLAGTARGCLYDAGVPAARFDEDGDIDGFVFWIRPERFDEALRILDDIEDEGDVYSRITIEVATDEGGIGAFAYHYLREVDTRKTVGRSWPTS